MNLLVSPQSLLNFSGSAPLTGWIEVDEDVGMGRDWVAATATAEAALVLSVGNRTREGQGERQGRIGS